MVVPESTECYETMHILNYFGFPFNIEEDNILKQIVKKEMGFRPEDEVLYSTTLLPLNFHLVPFNADRLFFGTNAPSRASKQAINP